MMERRILGKTGISVSRICFGSLTMAPLQGNYAVDRAAEVMAYAFSRGINFVDAAQLYRVYPQIRAALKRYPGADDIRICSKPTSGPPTWRRRPWTRPGANWTAT